ncbi:formin-F-like [Quillaja saponaria]|uniref:Formin-F-like n=1 Tax=Quillaja saponaria TaxID=32244 RepID=A0AAD7PCP3_QUISA|nr:formin-F-like [Quillaja saponaria]
MEEEIEMGLEKTKNKTMRKRSRSRRDSKGHSVINVAEARREIAYALHLHRSSSSASTSSPCVSPTDYDFGNSSSNCDFNVPFQGYSILEAMPFPGPIWSTTPPSILAEPSLPPPSASAPIEASLEFEWGDNQASSYNWWLGFLKNLDGDVINDKKSNYPFGENIGLANYSKEFSQEGSKIEETHSVDDSEENSSSPDEWLMFPTVEEEVQEELVGTD